MTADARLSQYWSLRGARGLCFIGLLLGSDRGRVKYYRRWGWIGGRIVWIGVILSFHAFLTIMAGA